MRLLPMLGLALASIGGHAQTAPKPATARIQPQDGHWNWDVGATRSSTGCVPGMAESLRQLLPAQRSERVQFERPFHPAQLIRHSAVRWEQRSPNHFVATAQGVTVQGFALPMDVHYDLHVVSPTQMRGEGSVQMNLWQPCSVSAPFDFRRLEQPPAPAAGKGAG